MLVSGFFSGSLQYGVNASGDFSSSQGGRCWLRGLACLLACLRVCVHLTQQWVSSFLVWERRHGPTWDRPWESPWHLKTTSHCLAKTDNIFVTFSGSLLPLPSANLYVVISEGKKDKDISVPTYLSISIFLSLTCSCSYRAGETHAHMQHLASHHSRFFTRARRRHTYKRASRSFQPSGEKSTKDKSDVITASASLIVHSDMLTTGDAHQHARERLPTCKEGIGIVNHLDRLINISGVPQYYTGISLHSNHLDFMPPLCRQPC